MPEGFDKGVELVVQGLVQQVPLLGHLKEVGLDVPVLSTVEALGHPVIDTAEHVLVQGRHSDHFVDGQLQLEAPVLSRQNGLAPQKLSIAQPPREVKQGHLVVVKADVASDEGAQKRRVERACHATTSFHSLYLFDFSVIAFCYRVVEGQAPIM